MATEVRDLGIQCNLSTESNRDDNDMIDKAFKLAFGSCEI